MKSILFSFLLITCNVLNLLVAGQQEVTVGNIKVKCLMSTPIVKDKTLPGLFVFIGPGQGDASLAPIAFDAAKDFCDKQGLLLVTPISDDDKGFIGGKNKIVIDLVNALIKEGKVSPKNVLIGGISRGGKAALQIAGGGELVLGGVIAVPGIADGPLEKTKGLKNLHVYLRIGSKDEPAQVFLDQTIRELKKGGAIIDGKLVENGAHVFKINWEEVSKWKETFTAKK